MFDHVIQLLSTEQVVPMFQFNNASWAKSYYTMVLATTGCDLTINDVYSEAIPRLGALSAGTGSPWHGISCFFMSSAVFHRVPTYQHPAPEHTPCPCFRCYPSVWQHIQNAFLPPPFTNSEGFLNSFISEPPRPSVHMISSAMLLKSS